METGGREPDEDTVWIICINLSKLLFSGLLKHQHWSQLVPHYCNINIEAACCLEQIIRPNSFAAVKEVKIASFSTCSPAFRSFSPKDKRLSLEVLVTNWTGIPNALILEIASWTPGSSLSSTWTVPDKSSISAETFLPPSSIDDLMGNLWKDW